MTLGFAPIGAAPLASFPLPPAVTVVDVLETLDASDDASSSAQAGGVVAESVTLADAIARVMTVSPLVSESLDAAAAPAGVAVTAAQRTEALLVDPDTSGGANAFGARIEALSALVAAAASKTVPTLVTVNLLTSSVAQAVAQSLGVVPVAISSESSQTGAAVAAAIAAELVNLSSDQAGRVLGSSDVAVDVFLSAADTVTGAAVALGSVAVALDAVPVQAAQSHELGNVGESVGATDALQGARTTAATVSESIALIDTYAKLIAAVATVLESTVALDAIGRAVGVQVEAIESIGIVPVPLGTGIQRATVDVTLSATPTQDGAQVASAAVTVNVGFAITDSVRAAEQTRDTVVILAGDRVVTLQIDRGAVVLAGERSIEPEASDRKVTIT